jgi:hypothetical protein
MTLRRDSEHSRERPSGLQSVTTETAVVDKPAEAADDGDGHHRHAHQ